MPAENPDQGLARQPLSAASYIGGLTTFRHDLLAWYAVYIQVHHEKNVASQLDLKSIECFLPLIEKWSKRRDRRKRIQVPLFPGYLFVRCRLHNAMQVSILKIPGTVYILKNSDGPIPIPDYQVQSLQTLLLSAKPLSIHQYLKEGDWVRVRRGPLEDTIGILVRKNPKKGRLVVSVDTIQQSVSVEIDIEDVEPLKRAYYL